MLLELRLIKLRIIEGAEFGGQAAQRPDQPELAGNHVDDDAEAQLLREIERRSSASRCTSLERIAGGERGS